MGITKLIDHESSLSIVKSFHEGLVSHRRARVLSALLASLIPSESTILDVGCGNGMVAHLLERLNPTLEIEGLEVMPRSSCLIKCRSFDGETIPLSDQSVDVCMFVDVLHHTTDMEKALKEARRVSRQYLLIKDHLCENKFDIATLSFMDWVGNRADGVSLPYNYKSKAQWHRILSECGLRITHWDQRLSLYPRPFNSLFGRNLHFIGLFKMA